MSAPTRERDLSRLVALATRRHERAAVALAAARAELGRVERVRDEQLALIGSMRAGIAALADTRPRAGHVSVDALMLEVRRRRWLLFDVRKEEMYLGTMHDDVADAEEALAARLGEWREAGTRLERLGALDEQCSRAARVRAARREDAAAGERGARAATWPGGHR